VEKPENVFVVWDLESSEVKIALQAVSRRPPAGFQVAFADPGKQRGDPLEEILLPGIQAAHKVLIALPHSAASEAAVAFETGLAIGLGKPIAIAWFAPQSLDFTSRLPSAIGQILKQTHPTFRIIAGLKDIRDLLTASAYQQVPSPEVLPGDQNVALCPSRGEGEALREELQAQRPDWQRPKSFEWNPEFLETVLRAAQLLWVVTPSSQVMGDQNAGFPLVAGIFFARTWQITGSVDRAHFQVLRARTASPIRSVQRFERTFGDLNEFGRVLRSVSRQDSDFLAVERLEIRNFKNIEHLDLDFARPSSLPGCWTCIAGINGSGKSSILQALCLVLLGEKMIPQLGGERIKRMIRRVDDQRLETEIKAIIRDGTERRTLYLPLSEQGIDSKLYSHPEFSGMLDLWDQLQAQLLVSYGASRNLSDFRDTRHSDRDRKVQRQMTLFDSLTQVASVEVLLDGGTQMSGPLNTLKRLLSVVLTGDLLPGSQPDRLTFDQDGTQVEVLDLPDGFRSTVAWLGDLCAAWHETASAEELGDGDPARIRGIVLLDEIDLHLHPSLQRSLVPRLREALPHVQFFVTTHSPLVLSSFDRMELIALDRQAESGIRELDRQIFAFSMDQVYEFLMGTPAQSTVIEEKLSQGTDPDLPLYLYQSEDQNEEQAKERLEERKRLVEKLRQVTLKS
jgi:predicted ATPase